MFNSILKKNTLWANKLICHQILDHLLNRADQPGLSGGLHYWVQLQSRDCAREIDKASTTLPPINPSNTEFSSNLEIQPVIFTLLPILQYILRKQAPLLLYLQSTWDAESLLVLLSEASSAQVRKSSRRNRFSFFVLPPLYSDTSSTYFFLSSIRRLKTLITEPQYDNIFFFFP